MSAADLAGRARRASGDESLLDELSARFLATAILTEIARSDGQHAQADQLLDELDAIARQLVPLFGPDDPRSLSALITVASAECESATTTQDLDRMERAVDVIAVAVQRMSAALGTDHPRTISALQNMATAEYRIANALGDESRLETATAMVTATVERATAARRRPELVVKQSPQRETTETAPWRRAVGSQSPPRESTQGRNNAAAAPYSPAEEWRAVATTAPDEAARPLVRPYAMTGGKTRPRHDLAIETLVITTAGPEAQAGLCPNTSGFSICVEKSNRLPKSLHC